MIIIKIYELRTKFNFFLILSLIGLGYVKKYGKLKIENKKKDSNKFSKVNLQN